jgi:hypothetical protein
MGLSIRSRRVVAARALERHMARLAAAEAAAAAAAEYEASFLDRHRAAAFLGISPHRLKRLMTAGRAPRFLKRGDDKQARVIWPIEELERYRADPAAYLAAMQADTATLPQS